MCLLLRPFALAQLSLRRWMALRFATGSHRPVLHGWLSHELSFSRVFRQLKWAEFSLSFRLSLSCSLKTTKMCWTFRSPSGRPTKSCFIPGRHVGEGICSVLRSHEIQNHVSHRFAPTMLSACCLASDGLLVCAMRNEWCGSVLWWCTRSGVVKCGGWLMLI